MKFVYFTHSLQSCWNHGNAHFLRGVLRDLVRRGHEVAVYEPRQSWSLVNLLHDAGDAGLDAFRMKYPELRPKCYDDNFDADEFCDGAQVVIVHEWNDPTTIAKLGQARRGGSFVLLFHDTHHRAISDPDAMNALDLRFYDGVLAFGATLTEVYRKSGWGKRAFTWHEAADPTSFHPPGAPVRRNGLVWVGNWGDGERTAELQEFLLAPAREAALPLDIFGVRYPAEALAALARFEANYRGWLPNATVSDTFAAYLGTVHVPRRYYAGLLPGIPTIRVFEALACGIPLVSAPWDDAEGLFRPGLDFLFARNGAEMARHLVAIREDAQLRDSLSTHGLETIRTRHTCAHRVDELLVILDHIGGQRTQSPSSPARSASECR